MFFLSALLVTLPAFADTDNFDASPTGVLSASWTGTKTGKGEPKWTIEKDASAPSSPNVLKQSGEATYPVAWKNDTSLKDGFVEVKFKAVSGKEDQAAGVIWRAKDADNYYICRANALEDNVGLYKTENGKRKSLDIVGRKGGYGIETKVAPNQWHKLRSNSEELASGSAQRQTSLRRGRQNVPGRRQGRPLDQRRQRNVV
jgi:hypothetical protein